MADRNTPGSNVNPAPAVFVTAFPSPGEMEREIRILRAERDELASRFAALPRATSYAAVQLVEADKALLAIRQARDAVMARSAEITEKLALAEEKIAELTDACDLAERARDVTLDQLQVSQRECAELRTKLRLLEERGSETDSTKVSAGGHSEETVAKLIVQFADERAQLQRQFEELKSISEAQTASLQAQIAAHSTEMSSAGELDRQRLEMADLRAEIESLREELRQARVPTFEAPPSSHSQTTLRDAPVPLGLHPVESKSIPELDAELAAMGLALQAIAENPSQLETLDVLASQFQDFAQRSLAAGCLGAHRLATVCAEVATWLRRSPMKIPRTWESLEKARVLLGPLAQPDTAARVGDPGGGAVYAVDDDVDNCECIAMALEKIALRTRYAMKADIALAELSKTPCDLVILDVDLGGSVDGFQLHQRIRGLEAFRNTPVLFVSGLTSARERLVELTGEDDCFVAKPYNLNELTLKTLTSILKARLAGH